VEKGLESLSCTKLGEAGTRLEVRIRVQVFGVLQAPIVRAGDGDGRGHPALSVFLM